MLQKDQRLVKLSLFLLLCFASIAATKAQSTVYFFNKMWINIECNLNYNGKPIGELRGPAKPWLMGTTKYPACSKKCVLNTEGKALFSVDFKYTPKESNSVFQSSAEIQLDLYDGSIHYIELTNKGLNDVQFKELPEKKGLKLLKKNIPLEDYIEE